MKQIEVFDCGFVCFLFVIYYKLVFLWGFVDIDDEMEIFVEIEGLISGCFLVECGCNLYLDLCEFVWQWCSCDLCIYGDSYVNVVFIYICVGGNCFNIEECGVWYCVWEVMVFVSEVVWYCMCELGFIGSFYDSVCYVELLVDFIGVFDDMIDELGYLVLYFDLVVGYFEG